MISTAEAWAVGAVGTILHTTDGGASWQRQASGTQERLDAAASALRKAWPAK
jgi:photosystem II stability/assembly factor-like uncharacterized protein